MKKRLVSRLPMLLLAILATACVYDFNPDLSGEEGLLIVEGDIVLGQTSSFSIRRSSALDSWNLYEFAAYSNLRVEASDGTLYPERAFGPEGPFSRGVGQIDLRGADPSLEYRLAFDCEGRHYASHWTSIVPNAVIDSMSFAINDAKTDISVRISTHSNESTGYYRWTAFETWEYRAERFATYYFLPAGSRYKGQPLQEDSILPYENGENLFYCWSSEQRGGLMTATTESLSEDRLVDHELYTLNYHDRKISYVYSVEVNQTRITEEAYRYWQMMERNSTNVGGLFSPEPSELRGNIVNVDDEAEMVLGYVSVVNPVKYRLFIDDREIRFYKELNPRLVPEYLVPGKPNWSITYREGWLPVSEYEPDNPEVTMRPGYVQLYNWLPANCVDCRFQGGTKQKPAYWPTPEI